MSTQIIGASGYVSEPEGKVLELYRSDGTTERFILTEERTIGQLKAVPRLPSRARTIFGATSRSKANA